MERILDFFYLSMLIDIPTENTTGVCILFMNVVVSIPIPN